MTDNVEEVIEQPEAEAVEIQQDAPEGETVEAEDTGLVLEIAEEPSEEPEHITELRRRYREQQKRLKELEAKSGGVAPQPALRAKPTLEGHDYDASSFEEDLSKWYEEKREEDARSAEVRSVQERAEQRWQNRLAYYDEAKEKLGAQDYDDAETTVVEILSAPFPGIMAEDVRIGIIKQGARDPAALVYALSKNPAKAKELAAIEDLVEFAWKASALETGMKVVRGKAPPPERRVSGGVPGIAGALDNTLDRLREEAAKTGDFSKVMAYKRQNKG